MTFLTKSCFFMAIAVLHIRSELTVPVEVKSDATFESKLPLVNGKSCGGAGKFEALHIKGCHPETGTCALKEDSETTAELIFTPSQDLQQIGHKLVVTINGQELTPLKHHIPNSALKGGVKSLVRFDLHDVLIKLKGRTKTLPFKYSICRADADHTIEVCAEGGIQLE